MTDDTVIVSRYREAIEILAYVGALMDAEGLKEKIENGDFSDEYEIVKQGAIDSLYQQPAVPREES